MPMEPPALSPSGMRPAAAVWKPSTKTGPDCGSTGSIRTGAAFQLELIYDHISFEEAYGGQFRAYSGEFADYSGAAQGIAFWEYPGAPEPNLVWDYDSDILSGLREPNSFSAVFTDETGLDWGYVPYLYGHRNFWICLDDPAETDFSVREIPQPELIPAQPPAPPPVSPLPAALVGAVVLVTAGLLFLLSRTRKQNG